MHLESFVCCIGNPQAFIIQHNEHGRNVLTFHTTNPPLFIKTTVAKVSSLSLAIAVLIVVPQLPEHAQGTDLDAAVLNDGLH